jgi:hypothetical protein
VLLGLRRPRDPGRPPRHLGRGHRRRLAAEAGRPGHTKYRAAAERIVDALAERHLARHGGLSDGCYDQHQNLATASELIWGDYFLLEALLALDGVIQPGTL